MAVVALVPDMLFASRLRVVADAAGVELTIVRDGQAALAAAENATAFIVDLNAEDGRALAVASELRQRRPGAPVVCYLAHVQRELAEQARQAGLDEVLTRSRFVEDLPGLLRRLAAH